MIVHDLGIAHLPVELETASLEEVTVPQELKVNLAQLLSLEFHVLEDKENGEVGGISHSSLALNEDDFALLWPAVTPESRWVGDRQPERVRVVPALQALQVRAALCAPKATVFLCLIA